MKRKVFQIGGIIALMITMTACGNQAQAETVEPTTVVETTIQETTAEPTTEESTAEPTEESYSGQRENGDAFVKLDLPTLSTGKTFDEIAAMQYDIVYNSWSTSSDTEKAELGREGLKDLLGSLIDFTDQEKNEVVDYILSKSPIPEVETKSESKPAQSSNSSNETKAAPKETQASVQPTQPAPQPTEPISYETDDTTELSPEMQERHRKLEEMAEQNGGSVGHEAGEGHGGTLSPEEEADWDNFHIGG